MQHNHTNTGSTSYGPEIDQRVRQLSQLLHRLDATIAQPRSDRHGVESLLARIDDSVAELNRVTHALGGVSEWPQVIDTRTGRARSEARPHRIPQNARRA